MSGTGSFTDPKFLADYGLFRGNAIEYFLHPLNPFKSKSKTCNETLAAQNITIGFLMMNGTTTSGPLTLERAEEEYNVALSRMTGEQYELLPPPPPQRAPDGAITPVDPQLSQLYTIRHVLRSKNNKVTTLGIYYIVQGFIYKAPTARALMKANIARTCQGLIEASDALSSCAKHSPSTGYDWDFESGSRLSGQKRTSQLDDEEIFKQVCKLKKKPRRWIESKPGERTEEEEESVRAKDKINAVLKRISKSYLVTGKTI
mmetsp:Transcript_12077/g.14975  ORF Transcript_12077/g.14975 Transcript_12077/m.14975 type:complete len:259 (+) Transcript_12077:229-1005(+)